MLEEVEKAAKRCEFGERGLAKIPACSCHKPRLIFLCCAMSAVPGTPSRLVSKEPSEEYRSPYIDYMKLVGTPSEFKLVVGLFRGFFLRMND
jgi:hypothetical protein